MTSPVSRPTAMDKDRLAAFVDGEMTPEEAARVVIHLADHPQDQAYVDDLMASNAALSQAFAAPLEEPVPKALRDLILGTVSLDPVAADPVAAGPSVLGEVTPGPMTQPSVVPFRARVWRGSVTLWGGMGVALAAGVAAAVFMPRGDGLDLTPGPLAVSGALHAALNVLPAGEVRVIKDGAEVLVLGSVPTQAGYCREIEVMQPDTGRLQAALACTDGMGWKVEVVIVEDLAQAAQAEGFGTAAGDEAQSFTPFLDRIGAGAFLGPQEEAAAIAKGWVP